MDIHHSNGCPLQHLIVLDVLASGLSVRRGVVGVRRESQLVVCDAAGVIEAPILISTWPTRLHKLSNRKIAGAP